MKRRNALRTLVAASLLIPALSFAGQSPYVRQAILDGYHIYKGNPRTFFCGCAFENKYVNKKKCGQNVPKIPTRESQLTWTHIVPLERAAKRFDCWKKGGLDYCRATSKKFNRLESDLYNLVPVIGKFDLVKKNYAYTMVPGHLKKFAMGCSVDIDSAHNIIEPPLRLRGRIARTYFYLEKVYGIGLTPEERHLYAMWNKQVPPDLDEIELNDLISSVQE